jgi:pSer/pThr/pTyr-binding forkhead associated (FHA) protein
MKDGQILEEIQLQSKAYYVVGRQQDVVDIFQENPTISRRHAVIQHKDTGDIFVYDLGSTHGTFVNKKLIPQHQYIKLSAGDMIRFGQSTRWCILSGGPEAEDNESGGDDEVARKPIKIVSKKQNEEFIMRNRVEQIKKMDQAMKMQKMNNLKRIHHEEEI